MSDHLGTTPEQPAPDWRAQLIELRKHLVNLGHPAVDAIDAALAEADRHLGAGYVFAIESAADFPADTAADRVQAVQDLIPADWDRRALSLAHELRRMMLPMVDEGTSIDSGGGDGDADLWPVIGGVEMHINIRPARVVK